LPLKKGAGNDCDPQKNFGKSNWGPNSEVVASARMVPGSAWEHGAHLPCGTGQTLSRSLERLLAPAEGDALSHGQGL